MVTIIVTVDPKTLYLQSKFQWFCRIEDQTRRILVIFLWFCSIYVSLKLVFSTSLILVEVKISQLVDCSHFQKFDDLKSLIFILKILLFACTDVSWLCAINLDNI